MVRVRHLLPGFRFPTLGALALVSGAAFAQEAPRAQVVEQEGFLDQPAMRANQAVSRSKQFIVDGGANDTRGMMAIFAEQVKDSLLRLLEEKDGWKVPIVINLHGKPGDPRPPRTVVPQLVLIGDQQRLQLDVHLSRGIERDVMERELMAMLLYETCLRKQPMREGDAPPTLKPWVLEGLREAIARKEGRSDRKLYDALFRNPSVMPYATVLSMSAADWENEDAASRSAFRAASGALVMSLLDQPNGKEGMRGFLSEVPRYEGEIATLLRKYFPGLNLSESSLEKWWLLQVAQSKEAKLAEAITIPDTEQRLEEALRLHLHDKDGVAMVRPLKEYLSLNDLSPSERAEAVRPAEDALVTLSYRCFPSYRPILLRYQEVLKQIALGKGREKIPVELDELEAIRVRMRQRAERTRDYLDWFVITRAEEASNAFDDYRRAKDELNTPVDHRNDGVSQYLDDMQKVFGRK